MATRTRETAPGKEKRGTSPSSNIPNTATTQRRRSPNPSKTNSPARPHHDSTSSEKHIPNYLKPTLSSGSDLSKQQGKKSVSSTDSNTQNKPTLTRRRSFDKPQPPSRTQKSRVSPNPVLRSSSFSGKSVGSPKGDPDKNLKAAKDGVKSQHTSLYARPVNTVKKGGIYIKKQESTTGSGSSRTKEQVSSPPEKVEIIDIPNVPVPETLSEDQDAYIAEAEGKTLQIDDNHEKRSEDLMLEGQELALHIEQTEEESDDKDPLIETVNSTTDEENHDAKIETVESPTVLENNDAEIVTTVESLTVLEHQDISPGEEPKSKSHAEEISSKQEELTDEMNNINSNGESVAGNANEEIEEQKREEEEEEAMALDKKEAEASGSEAHPESKEIEVKVVHEKQEAENPVTKVQVAHGKKDTALSNDVIEETASKLREQRKNKVKALAGAFETVISLQEPK